MDKIRNSKTSRIVDSSENDGQDIVSNMDGVFVTLSAYIPQADILKLPERSVHYAQLKPASIFTISNAQAFVPGVLNVNTAPSFIMGDGTVITDGGFGFDLALQKDGKILMAGNPAFSVVRFNKDGSLDSSFSGDGIVTTHVGVRNDDEARSVVVQADGKILVSGWSINDFDKGSVNFALVRYNSNGTLDTTFSGDGKVSTGFGSLSPGFSSSDWGQKVTLQSDGKILVAGYTDINTVGTENYDFGLVRYNSNGTLDSSFSGDGRLTTSFGDFDDYGISVAVQANGKIILAGISKNGVDNDFALVRYNSNGTLDTSFSGDGKVITTIGSSHDEIAQAVIVQSDGKILVAGNSINGSSYDFALVRYNIDGTLDTGFSGDGKVTTSIGVGNDFGRSVALQADGKILVSGTSWNGKNYDFAVVRYNSNGTLDTSFSYDGKLTTSFGSSDDEALSIKVQSDGKILVAGNLSGGGYALARYNPDGSLDNTFDTPADTLNGKAYFNIDNDYAVVLDSSVRIYDVELAAQGHYAGASITLSRHGGANNQDEFSGYGHLSLSGGTALLSGVAIGTVSNGNGLLKITFNSNATQSRVNETLSSLAYSFKPDISIGSVQIDWTFSDGNAGGQGAGGTLTAFGSTVVNISDYAANANTTGRLVVDGSSVGTIQSAADRDWFKVSLTAGKTYSINLEGLDTGKGTLSNPSFYGIYDNAGHFLGYQDNDSGAGFNSHINFMPITTGDYYLVAGADSTATGTYSLSVAAINSAPTFLLLGEGRVTTDFNAIHDFAYGIALQDDDRIVLAGRSNSFFYDDSSSINSFALARYDSDGFLDISFSGGKVITNSKSDSNDIVTDVAVQADGKVLAVGSNRNDNLSTSEVVLVRYNNNGTLDTSFSGDGKVTLNFSPSSADYGGAVAVQSDGKILISGATYDSIGGVFFIARYNSDGSLDKSFDVDGKFNVLGFVAESFALQSNGKILVAGYSSGFAVARYNSDGSVDTSFSGDGFTTTSLGAGDFGKSVAIQYDGKILVAGESGNRFGLVRYNVDGSLDNSFSGDGKVVTSFNTDPTETWVNSVHALADGKILVAGTITDGLRFFFMTRYNSDGSLDLSFDGDGKVMLNINLVADYNHAFDVEVQSNGKILVAGNAGDYINEPTFDFALTRFNPDGSLDKTFGAVNTLNGKPTFIENGSAVILDNSVQIFDAELASQGNYQGASITIARHGGANAQDVFSASGHLFFNGTQVLLSGLNVGLVTNNSGTLKLTFNSSATEARVNEVLSSIAYSNTSTQPPASVTIDWKFDDGNAGTQGIGGAKNIIGSTMVKLVDSVTITGTVNNDTLQGGAGHDVLSGLKGDDSLIGLSGKDTLSGGSGNDKFAYVSLQDSQGSLRDVITDFTIGDKVDLTGLDANQTTSINDAFSTLTFGTSDNYSFSSTNALYFDTANHILYGNVDKDTNSDFSILLSGVSSLNTSDLMM